MKINSVQKLTTIIMGLSLAGILVFFIIGWLVISRTPKKTGALPGVTNTPAVTQTVAPVENVIKTLTPSPSMNPPTPTPLSVGKGLTCSDFYEKVTAAFGSGESSSISFSKQNGEDDFPDSWTGVGIATGKTRTKLVPGFGTVNSVETMIKNPNKKVQKVWIDYALNKSGHEPESFIRGIFFADGNPVLTSPDNSRMPFQTKEDVEKIFSSPHIVSIRSLPGLQNTESGVNWDLCVKNAYTSEADCFYGWLLDSSNQRIIQNQPVPENWNVYGWDFIVIPEPAINSADLLSCTAE